MSLLMRQFGRPARSAACIPQACSSLKGLDGAGRSNSTGCASPGSRCRSGARPEGKVGRRRRGGEKAKRFRCGRQRGANEGAKRQRQPLNFTGSPPPSGRTAGGAARQSAPQYAVANRRSAPSAATQTLWRAADRAAPNGGNRDWPAARNAQAEPVPAPAAPAATPTTRFRCGQLQQLNRD